MAIKALEAANYLLSKTDEEDGETISNLKLQKLLYYAQGIHLAKYGKPIFDEPIQAWMHGPVVPAVYHKFKNFGENSIPRPRKAPDFFGKEKVVLDAVYRVYGQFSAWKLRNFTHDEPPWKDAALGATISHSSLKNYFKTQLV